VEGCDEKIQRASTLKDNTIGLAGGPYGNFAGRDASRGMAKQSFDLGALVGHMMKS
jgi:hypothetical protein